jgi:phospholipase C
MMFKSAFLLIVSWTPLCFAASKNIEHVIVLMLENRAFDHMLGFMKELNPDIDGCLPDMQNCYNHADPMDDTSDTYFVDNTAVYQQSDPSHSISGTTSQIYGSSPNSADMNGFIASYSSRTGSSEYGTRIMQCFAPDHVPAISTLASEFGLFDGWYASVPGPTQVNRAYAASATSHGMGTNDVDKIIRGFPQQTMFSQLEDMGLDYRVYFEFVPCLLAFKDMRRKTARQSYRVLPTLFSDLEKGDLPPFSFVEPRYYDTPGGEWC